ncbi:hypothetical protein H0H93_004003 [Arthromyces matolae]|nr:hypothetical protein H0H93_004003 [Arthromyces matolae]
MSASLGLRSLRTASLAPSKGFTITRCRAFHASSRRSEQYKDADIKTFNKVVNVPNRLIMVDFYAEYVQLPKSISRPNANF